MAARDYSSAVPVLRAGWAILAVAICFNCHAKEIQIGGMRNVKANVTGTDSQRRCALSFTAVTCFDKAANQQINTAKGKGFAIRAFALAEGVRSGTIAYGRLIAEEPTEIRNGIASAVYRVEDFRIIPPQEAKQPGNRDNVETPGSQRKAPNSPDDSTLLTCMNDMAGTLDALAEFFDTEIEKIESGQELDEMVVTLEQNGEDSFRRFEKLVENEAMLLSSEKLVLKERVKGRLDTFIGKLKKKYREVASGEPSN
jgi:hypothetical protein